jgi:hypothetical protein
MERKFVKYHREYHLASTLIGGMREDISMLKLLLKYTRPSKDNLALTSKTDTS